MNQLQSVENVRGYPAAIIKELEELLFWGGSALADPKRKDFYDLQNRDRTFFIHVSSITGRVALLATWLHVGRAPDLTNCLAGLDWLRGLDLN
jgi:hypothetical protein